VAHSFIDRCRRRAAGCVLQEGRKAAVTGCSAPPREIEEHAEMTSAHRQTDRQTETECRRRRRSEEGRLLLLTARTGDVRRTAAGVSLA